MRGELGAGSEAEALDYHLALADASQTSICDQVAVIETCAPQSPQALANGYEHLIGDSLGTPAHVNILEAHLVRNQGNKGHLRHVAPSDADARQRARAEREGPQALAREPWTER